MAGSADSGGAAARLPGVADTAMSAHNLCAAASLSTGPGSAFTRVAGSGEPQRPRPAGLSFSMDSLLQPDVWPARGRTAAQLPARPEPEPELEPDEEEDEEEEGASERSCESPVNVERLSPEGETACERRLEASASPLSERLAEQRVSPTPVKPPPLMVPNGLMGQRPPFGLYPGLHTGMWPPALQGYPFFGGNTLPPSLQSKGRASARSPHLRFERMKSAGHFCRSYHHPVPLVIPSVQTFWV